MKFFGRTARRLHLVPLGSRSAAVVAPTTLRAELTRSLNFYVVASLVVSATSTVPGLWTTAGWPYVVDDLVLAAMAGFAVAWYVHAQNRTRRSAVPFSLLFLAMVAKLIAVTFAHNQGAAYGGDTTVATFLASTVGLTAWRLIADSRAAARAIRLRETDQLLDALRQREGYGRPSAS